MTTYTFDSTKPADTDTIGGSAGTIRTNFNALLGTSGTPIVNAATLNNYSQGNAAGNVALSNGTLCNTLNADLLDGQHGSYYTNLIAATLPLTGGTITGQLNLLGNNQPLTIKNNYPVPSNSAALSIFDVNNNNNANIWADGRADFKNSVTVNGNNVYHTGNFVSGTNYLSPSGSAANLTGLTASQVNTALGYNPINKTGDTMIGNLILPTDITVLNTDLTLFSYSAENQFLDANGTTRNITFPTTGLAQGQKFRIINTAALGNGVLNIPDVGGVTPKTQCVFTWDGSQWFGAVPTSISGNGLVVGSGCSASSTLDVVVGLSSGSANSSAVVGFSSGSSGNYGVSLGYNAHVTAAYSVALGGNGTYNARVNTIAHSADGYNYGGWSGWQGTTAATTATELFLGGVSNARATIPQGSVMTFDIIVNAFNTVSYYASSWKITGTIMYNATTVVLVGTPTVTSIGTTSTSCGSVAVSADTTNMSLKLAVTPLSAGNTKWNAWGTYVQINK